jgi:adenosine deaminase
MRGKDNEKQNFETVELAKKYLGKGVCAVDLAGAEALYKTREYKRIFEYVKELEIPFTIHAGEADGVESIKDAISFGAKRIGHGVRAIEDEKLIEYLKKNKITLEVCPTSNIQTCICESYSTHPISKLYNAGVLVTINTDNMTVSNTTLANEYINIIQNTNINYDDIVKMNINAINASFISEQEKDELLKKYLGGIKLENK